MKNTIRTPLTILQNIANLIYQHSGIEFPPSHVKVLDQRIQSRIKEKQYTVENLYSELLLNKDHLFEFIGYVTTNHTHFFRSIEQFHALGNRIIPELLKKNCYVKHIALWSCACSSGEEPYTLALYLQHYFDTNNLTDWRFSIFATDIDQHSLATAEKGIYPYKALKYIPQEYHSYLEIHSDNDSEQEITQSFIKIPKVLKSTIKFRVHNLMESLSAISHYDIIFCRNVLIYFNAKTQEQVINRLVEKLAPNRYFLISPVESILELDTPLSSVVLDKCVFYTNNR